MSPKDIQTTHDVVRWLRNYIEWRDESSRDMMLRAVDVLTRDGYPRSAFEEAARVCDAVALGRPFNRNADDPRAAYQAGAAKCAWELRQKVVAK